MEYIFNVHREREREKEKERGSESGRVCEEIVPVKRRSLFFENVSLLSIKYLVVLIIDTNKIHKTNLFV